MMHDTGVSCCERRRRLSRADLTVGAHRSGVWEGKKKKEEEKKKEKSKKEKKR